MPFRKKKKIPKPDKRVPISSSQKRKGAPRTAKFWFVLLLATAFIAVLAITNLIYLLPASQPQKPVFPLVADKSEIAAVLPHKNYVGAKACKQCHQEEFDKWTGSHHALAMQEASEKTVLGDFNNAEFYYHGIKSTFFRRDGKFYVNTDGPDGKLTNYPIQYTFGVTPLQQYLIEFPGGRYQALSIAWDSRPQAEGGQRWFHLYPNEKVDHTDQLHWTGRYQNWNLECAECHSTNLKKGYNAMSDSYNTAYSELNVSCESCHGPASQHIDWAHQAQPPYAQNDTKGLAVTLQSHWQEAWAFPQNEAKFARNVKPATDDLMNPCWACHARRSTLVEGALPGLPLEDSHRPALLTQPTYYADGQQRDENYTWGSFRQSKMFQNGVTCMDCHEPHALKLRAEGNALCARCHNAAEFDSTKHHFHNRGSKGAQCIDCHAPKQNYMVVDGRHDHSFRLPRPDLSISLGSPNACTLCHQNQKSVWAAAAMDKWYGKNWRARPHYGTVLHAGSTQGIKALPLLLELAQDASSPAIVRATALTLISPMMRPELLVMVRAQLQDTDPSVRMAALGLLEPVDPINRVLSASPLLNDPVLGVRIEAARILADVPETQIPADKQNSYKKALKEYLDSLHQDADWPASNVNLGNLLMRQGKVDAAIAAYERALTLDPRFAGAYVNLADVYRQQKREDEGEKKLRQGLALLPNAADLHHTLGLLLVRKGDMTAALNELKTAARLATDNARYAYVYAVGLNSSGKRREALSILKATETRSPYNLEILSALISMHREEGDSKSALVYARKAQEAMPGDPGIKQLIDELKDIK